MNDKILYGSAIKRVKKEKRMTEKIKTRKAVSIIGYRRAIKTMQLNVVAIIEHLMFRSEQFRFSFFLLRREIGLERRRSLPSVFQTGVDTPIRSPPVRATNI